MTKALLHELGKSLSYGRLSLLAKVLWPMILSTSDDQGRGTAEADAIKWYVCPNVPEITIDKVPGLLQEMGAQAMIVLYECKRGGLAYQILRWWEYQSLRWARPSRWEAPAQWTDRIRYSDAGQITESNWDKPGGLPNGTDLHDYIANYTARYTEHQPNLTQLNLTQPQLYSGADAPAPTAPSCFPDLFNTSIKDIQAKTFTRSEWEQILQAERDAGGRATLIKWIDSKLNGGGHPAIRVYRDEMGNYPYSNQYADIIGAIGEGGNMDLWRSVVSAWRMHGWNKYNIAGMLEAYEAGGVKAKPNGSGRTGGLPARKQQFDIVGDPA